MTFRSGAMTIRSGNTASDVTLLLGLQLLLQVRDPILLSFEIHLRLDHFRLQRGNVNVDPPGNDV